MVSARHMSLTTTVHAPDHRMYYLWWRHNLGAGRGLHFRLEVHQTPGGKQCGIEWQCHMEIALTRPLVSEDRVMLVSTGPTRRRAMHELRRKLNLFAFAAPRFHQAGKLKRARKPRGT